MGLEVTPASYTATPDVWLVLTGPASGDVTLSDGTVYDVTPGAVAVPVDAGSPVDSGSKDADGNPIMVSSHVAELADACSQQLVDGGHPAHDDETPFTFTPILPADAGSTDSQEG